jgi:hypothetical protein
MISLIDITGAGTTVPIAFPTGFAAWWVQFIVTGTGTVRLGDSTTTSGKGLPIVSGAGMFTPIASGEANFYHSNEFYAYIPTGATLSVGIKEAQGY